MSDYTEQQKQTDLQFLDHVEGLMHAGNIIVDMEPGHIVDCLTSNEILAALGAYVNTYERIDMSVDEAFPPERLKRYLNVNEALLLKLRLESVH